MTLEEAVIVLNRERHRDCDTWGPQRCISADGHEHIMAMSLAWSFRSDQILSPLEARAIAEKYQGAGRCRTCRWWSEDQSPIPGKRVCALASSALGEPEHPETLAATWEGEDCYAVLITNAEFGCVQWERAEAPTDDAGT